MAFLAVEGAIDDVAGVGQGGGELPIEIGIVLDNEKAQRKLRSEAADQRALYGIDGNPVKLTSHEYRLLAYLMHHAGRVVSRTELVEHLYDQDFDRDSNTIEVFVGRIRKKLGVDVIQTVRGLGYLLTPPDAH